MTYFFLKIDKIFEGLANVFVIPDNILILWYDAGDTDHDKSLRQVI